MTTATEKEWRGAAFVLGILIGMVPLAVMVFSEYLVHHPAPSTQCVRI